jgi:hypothetical protein
MYFSMSASVTCYDAPIHIERGDDVNGPAANRSPWSIVDTVALAIKSPATPMRTRWLLRTYFGYHEPSYVSLTMILVSGDAKQRMVLKSGVR